MDERKTRHVLGLLTIILMLTCNQRVAGQTTPQPPSCGYTSWQSYYSSWYLQYPQYAYKGVYPFGSYYCGFNASYDQKTQGFNVGITFPINFYGTVYRSISISGFGYLILNQTMNSGPNQYAYSRSGWPNEAFPLRNNADPPLIAPFYANIYYPTGTQTNNGYDSNELSWMLLDPSAYPSSGSSSNNQNMVNVINGMLEQITKDIRAASLDAMYFQAQWGVMATYYNVTVNLPSNEQCSAQLNGPDTCPRNTFQVAVVTDGTNTFAVYNYFNITWLGDALIQQCNVWGGNSSGYPNCVPAQMGFNSGFGRGFTSLPYANTSQQIDMDSLSGTNVTGRWIYRISGDVVRHGGCTNDTSLAHSGLWNLTINPLSGPMFGGNVVNVSGPCFLKGASVKCRFGSVVTSAYNWGDMMQVMCVQPMLYEVGPVNLSVSVDGGQNYYFSAIYTVIQQERYPQLVSVVNTNNNWLKPTTIYLNWNPANLSSEWGNVVTIQLMGYLQKNWQVIYTFQFEAANSGSFSFPYNNEMCYNQNNHDVCAKYQLGAFRVSLSNWQWDYKNPMALWSTPVPLAWFMVDQVSHDEGSGWSHDNCRNWYKNDTFQTSYLPPCPCTLNQSYVDMAFYPSTDCNINNYNQPSGCPRNKGAMACYESVNVTSSGSNSRCCYNTYGNLMYSEDAVNGSVSQYSSPSGKFPYNNDPYIPSISNWEHDILPYYYCCVWQNNPYDCYNIYMVSRPTQDCKNYNPPGHATAYGDPHFITFDGTAYAFNGWGEFWLLQILNAQVAGGFTSFSLQGRFQQPMNKTWGTIRATVMSAAAMQLNGGSIVTIMSNLYGDVERLLVYVNNTLLNFTTDAQAWQQFPDFFIVNNDNTGANSNFSVLFRIGIGVNVAWQTGVMQMFVTVPAQFKYHTGGLFGYWSDSAQDDLMPMGAGSTPIGSSDPQTIFNSFGMTWIVQAQDTLFTNVYRASLQYNYYRNEPWFTPWFNLTVPPGSPASTSNVQNICFGDTACEYDYYVTANQTVAAQTHAITMWDAQIRQMGANKMSCGWLAVMDSTKYLPVSYLVGSQVTITGCFSGFMMTGGNTKTFTCQQSGTTAMWSSPINIYCQYLNGQPPPAVQAAIAVPICVCGAIAIVLVIIFACRYQKRKERREGRREKRAERQEERKLDSIPPEPLMEQKEVIDGALLNQAKPSYNNIVTGALSESYIERGSRSSTPSKMSVHTGVSNVTNGRVNGGVMVTQPLQAPPRSRTPSQGYPAYGSRSGTPTQGVSRTIVYTTDPGKGKAEVTLSVQAQAPAPMPYQYLPGRQSPYEANRAENYYSRRYAPGPGSVHDNDSEV